MSEDQMKQIIQMYESGLSVKAIADQTGFAARSTISGMLRKLNRIRSLEQVRQIKSQHRVGEKIGLLTLLERRGPLRDKHWLCQCDCGNRVEIDIFYLAVKRPKKPRSCGCLTPNKGSKSTCWRGYEELSNSMFGRFKRGATERGLPFDISIEEAWSLYLKQDRRCALSGIPILISSSPPRRTSTASMDRIDNSRGYTLDNIRWVHKWLNILKSDVNDPQFFALVKAIYEHQKLADTAYNAEDVQIALDAVPFPKKPRMPMFIPV